MDVEDCGYTGAMPGLEVRLNGELLRDVITADDATGEIVRYKRDARGDFELDALRESILTEVLTGCVTFTRQPL